MTRFSRSILQKALPSFSKNNIRLAIATTEFSSRAKSSNTYSVNNFISYAHFNNIKEKTIFINKYSNMTFYKQLRTFAKHGRKGAAMGHHRETLEREEQKQLKKKKVNQEQTVEEEEETTTMLPETSDVKNDMLQIVTKLEESFLRIRGAEPTTELFDTIPIRAYGSYTPLNTIAQVVITTPSLVTITCFDPSIAPTVRDAVRDAGYNFNPSVHESSGDVLVPIPRVSQETRFGIVKNLNKMAEKARLQVRNVRKKYNHVIKLGKDGKLEGISKDEAFAVGKELDEITAEIVKIIGEKVAEKENKIMDV